MLTATSTDFENKYKEYLKNYHLQVLKAIPGYIDDVLEKYSKKIKHIDKMIKLYISSVQ